MFWFIVLGLAVLYMISSRRENFTPEEQSRLDSYVAEGKLNPNASVNQKRLALRMLK